MLELAEARDRVLAAFVPLDTIEVKLNEASGLVTAETHRAPHALPRFDNSSMDGFAVRHADVDGARPGSPAKLTLVGEVAAGGHGEVQINAGQAARLMTGAPIPPGADAVVPVEATESAGESEVAILKTPIPGAFIREAGEDLRAGDVAVEGGEELGPGAIALLAALGVSPIKAHCRPKVALVTTGDELAPPEATDLEPAQIRDSNSLALRLLAEEAGAEPISIGPVPDERQAVVEALSRAAQGADLVVSSGGVSVGEYDFVRSAVEELGQIEFWRVAMQPGKPVVSGYIGGTGFLGLPGNPVSIHVGFEQFVRPAIRKLRGCRSLFRPVVTATLTETIRKTPGRLHLVRVKLTFDDRAITATPTGLQGSHIQSSLVGCDGLARFAKDASVAEAGSSIDVEVWRVPEVAV